MVRVCVIRRIILGNVDEGLSKDYDGRFDIFFLGV